MPRHKGKTNRVATHPGTSAPQTCTNMEPHTFRLTQPTPHPLFHQTAKTPRRLPWAAQSGARLGARAPPILTACLKSECSAKGGRPAAAWCERRPRRQNGTGTGRSRRKARRGVHLDLVSAEVRADAARVLQVVSQPVPRPSGRWVDRMGLPTPATGVLLRRRDCACSGQPVSR